MPPIAHATARNAWLTFPCLACLWFQQLLGVQPPDVSPSVTVSSPVNLDSDRNEIVRLAQRLDDDDDWAKGFFDLDGPSDPDRDEKPKPLQLDLPSQLEQATPLEDETSPQMAGWIRWLILQNLPPNYEDKRKWGKTKQLFDGWDFEREGLKIETRRKYKTVNHGTWTRYFVEWIEPATALKIQLTELEEVRPRFYAFQVFVESPLHVFGRMSRYQWDAQLISLSADAEAYVKLWLNVELEVRVNPLEIPPMLQFVPHVTDGKIEMTSFRMTRLSHFKGPLVKVLSSSLREIVEDKVEEYNDKLVEKVNRQLDKQQDKLKLSLQTWLSSKIGTTSIMGGGAGK